MNPVSKKKYFTVEEANHTLPLVRAIVTDIVNHFREIHERKERLLLIRPKSGGGPRETENVYSEEVQQIEDELEKDVARLHDYVDEVQSLGVELKDFVRGLVDFPAIIEGREVYLCWQLGEAEVSFWHELDSGFQGRQSLMANSAGVEKDSGQNI